MTIADYMQPLVVVFQWLRETQIIIGEVSFTFMDMIFWTMLASVVIYWLNKIID